jgi:hypothetical protein
VKKVQPRPVVKGQRSPTVSAIHTMVMAAAIFSPRVRLMIYLARFVK